MYNSDTFFFGLNKYTKKLFALFAILVLLNDSLMIADINYLTLTTVN